MAVEAHGEDETGERWRGRHPPHDARRAGGVVLRRGQHGMKRRPGIGAGGGSGAGDSRSGESGRRRKLGGSEELRAAALCMTRERASYKGRRNINGGREELAAGNATWATSRSRGRRRCGGLQWPAGLAGASSGGLLPDPDRIEEVQRERVGADSGSSADGLPGPRSGSWWAHGLRGGAERPGATWRRGSGPERRRRWRPALLGGAKWRGGAGVARKFRGRGLEVGGRLGMPKNGKGAS